jgi:hypothetical protein
MQSAPDAQSSFDEHALQSTPLASPPGDAPPDPPSVVPVVPDADASSSPAETLPGP